MKKFVWLSLLLLCAAIGRSQIVGGPLFGCTGQVSTGTAWNSGTSNNTTQAVVNNSPVGAVLVQLDQTTTITAGAITVQGTYDGINFITVPSSWVIDPRSLAQVGNPYTLVASTNQPILIQMNGMISVQLKLTTAITGSGAVTPYVTPNCVAPSPNFAQPQLRSYTASATVSSAASATDIAVLPGNATDTILVYDMHITCTQTTAGIVTVNIIKRSTADTSGTSSSMTVVPDDSNFAAGSSAPLTYTANPTAGTAVGNIDTVQMGCMAAGTTSPNDFYVPLDWKQKPIVLRGTAQQLAVNLGGTTISGGSFNITFKWIELP